MSDSDIRRDRIRSAWEAAWDRGDVDALDAVLSPDYRRVGASGDAQNLTEFKASIIATRSAFPDLVTVVDDLIVEGDRVAVYIADDDDSGGDASHPRRDLRTPPLCPLALVAAHRQRHGEVTGYVNLLGLVAGPVDHRGR